jgi:hypothetical protein
MLPEGLTKIPFASFGNVECSALRVGDLGIWARDSIGVGGVTVVNGGFDPPLVGVCGRSLVLIAGRPGLDVLGRSEGSNLVPVRIREGAGLLVCMFGRASFALISDVSTSPPLPRGESLSGLPLGLLLDLPG